MEAFSRWLAWFNRIKPSVWAVGQDRNEQQKLCTGAQVLSLVKHWLMADRKSWSCKCRPVILQLKSCICFSGLLDRNAVSFQLLNYVNINWKKKKKGSVFNTKSQTNALFFIRLPRRWIDRKARKSGVHSYESKEKWCRRWSLYIMCGKAANTWLFSAINSISLEQFSTGSMVQGIPRNHLDSIWFPCSSRLMKPLPAFLPNFLNNEVHSQSKTQPFQATEKAVSVS